MRQSSSGQRVRVLYLYTPDSPLPTPRVGGHCGGVSVAFCRSHLPGFCGIAVAADWPCAPETNNIDPRNGEADSSRVRRNNTTSPILLPEARRRYICARVTAYYRCPGRWTSRRRLFGVGSSRPAIGGSWSSEGGLLYCLLCQPGIGGDTDVVVGRGRIRAIQVHSSMSS